MRLPKLRSSAPPRQRIHDLLWRLRSDEFLRPSLLDPRWLDVAARARIEELLRERPLVMLDLGARGGVQDLKELKSVTRLFGFEPNEEQCEPLQHESHRAGYLEARFLPVAVGGRDGTGRLIITRSAGSTSFLEPDLRLLRSFDSYGAMFEPVGEEIVPTVTLDRFASDESLDYVDLLKMDIQGSELDVVRGGERLLGESVLMVKAEVWFRHLYREQPLFRDVDAELGRLGFTLLALDPFYTATSRKRTSLPPEVGDRGELLFGDAVYVKDVIADPARVATDDPARLLRFVLILESFGFTGYALEAAALFRAAGAPESDLLQALEQAIVDRHGVHWYEREPRRKLRNRVVRRLAGRTPYR